MIMWNDKGFSMNTFLKIVGGIAAFLAVIALLIVLFLLTPLSSTPVGQGFSGLLGVGTNSVTNAAIDASGIKSKAEDALLENASTIAKRTGMSEAQVNKAIKELDLESWTVTSLPKNAQETGSQSIDYGGVSAEVTTYSDPSYITVSSSGQTFTLAVPENSQEYISLLQYL